MSSSIILNIPHSSTLLPREDIPSPYHEPKSMAYWSWGGKNKKMREIYDRYVKEIPYMTDWYTDELYINGIGKPLVAPVSRLLCDMERFKDDLKEEMSVVGMGICYTQTHDLKILTNFKFSHKMEMIRKYYDPYHQMLTNYTEEAIAGHKCALLIDCHSFSNSPYECDLNYACDRPDICLGTDPEHTPKELREMLTSYFENLNYSVKENYPFSGTIIPNGYENNRKLYSIMIEINRALYLKWEKDEVKKKEEEFLVLKERIHGAEKLIQSFMDSRILELENDEKGERI